MEKKLIKRFLICGTLILTGLSTHTLFAQTLSEAAALLKMQSNSAPKAASSPKAQSNDIVKAASFLLKTQSNDLAKAAGFLLKSQSNDLAKTAGFLLKAQNNDLAKTAALLNIQVKKPAKAPVKVSYSVNPKVYVYSDQENIPARLKTDSASTVSDDVISHLDNLVKGVLNSQKTALVSKRKTQEDQEVAAAQKAVAALKAEQRAAKLKRFQQVAAQKTDKPVPVVINSSKVVKPKTNAKNLAKN